MFGFRRECNYGAFICNIFLSINASAACKCTTFTQKVLNEWNIKKVYDQNLGLAEKKERNKEYMVLSGFAYRFPTATNATTVWRIDVPQEATYSRFVLAYRHFAKNGSGQIPGRYSRKNQLDDYFFMRAIHVALYSYTLCRSRDMDERGRPFPKGRGTCD